MKITENDVKSIQFASILCGEVKKQTLNDRQRSNLEIHQQRLRKVYLLLLTCSQSRVFDFEYAVHHGIEDNTKAAHSIAALTPKAANELDLG